MFNFYFSLCFTVKHCAEPSTKLTLTLLAKFRPFDVKMSHAMRIKVSGQYCSAFRAVQDINNPVLVSSYQAMTII
jgi:hypothetical protein